jgi:hypothetical protein
MMGWEREVGVEAVELGRWSRLTAARKTELMKIGMRCNQLVVGRLVVSGGVAGNHWQLSDGPFTASRMPLTCRIRATWPACHWPADLADITSTPESGRCSLHLSC